MRRQILILALSLAAAWPLQSARAQQGGASEPIVRVTVDPSRVVVGQNAILQILILAPNYMTSPPELPSFQVRNAVTRQRQSVNTSEQHGETTYAGVRFEYAIYPQEPGAYAVADQSARITYAAEPPATRAATISLPRIAFEAFVPDAATSLRPFVSASKLSAQQTIKRSSEPLKPGDAVTRTITITAEGTPAMLLPPQPFAALDGLKLYPAQPSLEDKVDGRTDAMTASRTDSGTYMLERGGKFSLPAIDIGWWKVEGGKVETIHLEAVAFDVEGGASAESMTSGSWTSANLFDAIVDHWLAAALAAIVIIATAWAAPAMARRFMQSLRNRHAAYLNSETWSFRRLRNAVRKRSASATYFGLLAWLQRFEPIGQTRTINALMSAVDDPILEQQIAALQGALFAPEGAAVAWSPRTLIRHVRSARRTLLRRSRHGRTTPALPQQINPADVRTTRSDNRRVAR